jgi:hypothetical protein
MSATAITWYELVYASEISGDLPVVIPTASAPLAGVFAPKGPTANDFTLACFSAEPRDRCVAAIVACFLTRHQEGMDK